MDPPIGHRLTLWKSEQMPAKKRDAFRRLSFFRPPSIVEEPPPTILTTNTICRDFDPETGKKIINRFLMLREIGRGVHGKVKLAKDLDTGEFVAMKIIDKKVRKKQLGYTILRINNTTDNPQFKDWKQKTELKLRREIAILKKCAHPNIVRLKAVIDDPKSSKIYLALEYMEHGELIWREDEDSNKPMLTMQEARSIFRDVVSGLNYLHYQGIIHRDIKPANLLLSNDNTVKITDFGVSYFNPNLAGSKGHYDEEIDRDLTETAGTPAFFAPELCVSLDHTKLNGGKQNKHPITKAIDVWALGVTLHCLIYGRCPFTGRNQFELMEMIPKAPLVFPTKEEMGFETPASLKHLLEGLLCKNYKKRMTLEQVKRHPWVIEDLEDPRAWWKEADPRNYKAVKVTEDDVAKAVTVMDKLRKSIRRISTSLSNLSLVRLH